MMSFKYVGEEDLDAIACQNFSDCCIQLPGPVAIVISSSWRYTHSDDQLQGILSRNGIHHNVLGSLPVVAGHDLRDEMRHKGKEIEAFLQSIRRRHRIDDYVVVTTDTDEVYETISKKRVVDCNRFTGFSKLDKRRVFDILTSHVPEQS